MSCARTAYGDKPAFSLSVNHLDVYTGISDDDRSLTMMELDRLVRDRHSSYASLVRGFYSPGQVFLLIGRGIKERHGHTELALELGRRAGLGAIVLCEMLGKGNALPKAEAKAYAKERGLLFIEGRDLI